ncbi:hypothetical protein [Spongiactinospora sp. 9N601]|uniref:hypothetical protein n=1 Tax=Spongiactinospora sp. 9N601 TaxID=3375149 RepID=UPI0037A05613
MSLRRQLATVAGSAALAIGAAVLAPSPAMAAPTGCTAWLSNGYAHSSCTGGTGQHSVAVTQWHPYAGVILVTGPWKAAGEVSSVRLPPYETRRVFTNVQG